MSEINQFLSEIEQTLSCGNDAEIRHVLEKGFGPAEHPALQVAIDSGDLKLSKDVIKHSKRLGIDPLRQNKKWENPLHINVLALKKLNAHDIQNGKRGIYENLKEIINLLYEYDKARFVDMAGSNDLFNRMPVDLCEPNYSDRTASVFFKIKKAVESTAKSENKIILSSELQKKIQAAETQNRQIVSQAPERKTFFLPKTVKH